MSVLVALVLTFSSGCLTTQPTAPTAPEPPPHVTVQKAKDGPKRPPLPGTVVAVAIMREREGDKAEDAALRIKLYDDARQYYQEALRLDAKYRDAVQGLARVYARMDDFEHAFDIYNKALDSNPKDHGLWFDLGMCHSRKKDLPEAIRCFQKALDLDPENRQYMKTLGFTLARTGATEQSLALLTRAMGTALAHYNIARMMEHMGQTDQSRHHLQLALQINPNLDEARALLDAPATARGTIAFSTE